MSGVSLGQLKPDYVLDVEQEYDSNGDPSDESVADLERLVEELESKGFSVLKRLGNDGNQMVFVRLDDSKLLKVKEDDAINDWICGVNSNVFASTADQKQLVYSDKLRLAYQVIHAPTQFGGCGITPGDNSWYFVKSISPVSNYQVLKLKFKESRNTSTAFNDYINNSNIEFVLENFGSKYAFYHYFINSYIAWLFPLAVIGFVCNIIFLRYSIVFTVINLIWSIAFYLNWKLTQSKLAKKWGLSKNIHKLERPTSVENLNEPSYKILLKELGFIPTALVFVCILVLCQFFCFTVEIFLNEIYDGPLKPYLSLVPTILLSLMVPVVTMGYNLFVSRSLKWEGHARNSSLTYSRVFKTFVFNFLTSYMALFITSFLYLPFGYKLNSFLPSFESRYNVYKLTLRKDSFSINGTRLNLQYQYFMIINQIIGLALEFVLPLVLPKILNHPTVKGLMGKEEEEKVVFKDSEDEKEYLLDIRSMLQLPDYDIDDDYRQLVLQFGYLVLFGPVWSLGPLCSLIVTLIQQKLDFLKILKMVKPPVPERSDSIFPWDDFVKFLVWLGSLTSITISIMYNTDTVSSAYRSAVGIRWWKIVGPALILEHVVAVVIKVGEITIDYYIEYLEKKTTKTDYETLIRENYLDSVFQRKSQLKAKKESTNDVAETVSKSKDEASEKLGITSSEDPKASNDSEQIEEQTEQVPDAATSNIQPSETTNLAAQTAAVAIGAATTAAATVQSKITDFQSSNDSTTMASKTEDSAEKEGLDLQDGDRVITSKANVNGEMQPVLATIDDNNHFEPEGIESEAEAHADETFDSTAANTTAATTDTSRSVKSKKSKSALKKLFKKI